MKQPLKSGFISRDCVARHGRLTSVTATTTTTTCCYTATSGVAVEPAKSTGPECGVPEFQAEKLIFPLQ